MYVAARNCNESASSSQSHLRVYHHASLLPPFVETPRYTQQARRNTHTSQRLPTNKVTPPPNLRRYPFLLRQLLTHTLSKQHRSLTASKSAKRQIHTMSMKGKTHPRLHKKRHPKIHRIPPHDIILIHHRASPPLSQIKHTANIVLLKHLS